MHQKALTREEQALVAEVSSDRLMESTTAIAGWVRLSGTPEEAQAFDYIEEQLREAGLETSRYLHPGLVSWPESASLVVASADGAAWDVECSSHSFAASTPEAGLEGELLYLGSVSEESLRAVDARGRIVLVDGLAGPNSNLLLERAGVIASVWDSGSHLRGRTLSPVWGTPAPETAHLLPRTPSVSIREADARRLKAAHEKGPVRVRLHTRVFRGWKQLPCLIADLRPPAASPEADTFVMLSGHVDSWWNGAMDNGTANATQIEVGRLLASRRPSLRRGLRLAFWSGHSHGRYAGSTWYADNFWQELHDRCVAHVNIDSVGAKGAIMLSGGHSMAELRSFVSDTIEQMAGQRLSPRRYSRAGDQSFWGHGIPATLMALSHQPAEGADPALLAYHHLIAGGKGATGGLGWWWHTAEDTLDKIDPAFLRRDAGIYLVLLYRLCTLPLLPLAYGAVVAEMGSSLKSLQGRCREHFDLSLAREQLALLETAVGRLQGWIERQAASDLDARATVLVNRCLMELGRALIPVDYAATGPFDHDLAVPTRSLPGLQPAERLPSLPVDGDEYHFLRTRLVRERNRLVFGLVAATRSVEATLSRLEAPGA